ncbi:MAG TPA: AraC family transcriptional regulator, partial [Vicinamibacteria bacterium]|nr:AraC family transcriptional regulator [Vicinamibacteria bacterium]
MSVLVNPPVTALGTHNVLLQGHARTYHVRDFPGPLSVKSVVRGEAWWETADGRFHVEAGRYLILNHGQPYSITVESREEVETLCAFFAEGFVEDVLRGLLTTSARLMEDPDLPPACGFLESVRPLRAGVATELLRMHAALKEGSPPELWLEARFLGLARALHAAERDLEREAARLPALRASTRAELYRRLRRARDFVDSSLDRKLSLAIVSRVACLSPYHFHRLFAAAFGETLHAYIVRQRLER